MADFFEFTPAGDSAEQVSDLSVADALRDIARVNDMNAEDASWLEGLFQRIVEPLKDMLDGDREGTGEYRIREAAEQWHVQDGNYSCAVCSQQFIINEFLDLELTEAQLCTIAEASGWYDPESGTTPENVDNLLELFGIESKMDYQGDFRDLKKTLAEGGRAIVAVDSKVLWVEGAGNYPVYGADHAIEVIGIDDSDPDNVKVIINDSGTQDGCGKTVPVEEFMEAWGASGGFMVSAYPKD